MEIIYSQEKDVVNQQIVLGCTCLEFDRLFSLENKPLLSVGDRFKYNNVGAYTMCLTPLFIKYIPKVYLQEIGQFTLIRDKWTAYEYIQK